MVDEGGNAVAGTPAAARNRSAALAFLTPDRCALWLFVALATVSLVWLVDPYFESMWDAVLYVLTTRSLLAGDGYAVYGDPFSLRPPGFSLMLAPVMALFGDNFLVWNLFVSLLGITALALLFVYLRPRLGVAVTFAVCTSIWINPQYQSLCNTTLSDTAGLAAILGCLLLERRYRRAPSPGWNAALGLAIGVACYLRTVAILLVPAILLARLATPRAAIEPEGGVWIRARRLLLLALLPFAVQLPWTVWKSNHPSPFPAEQYGIYSYDVAQWHTDSADPDSPRLSIGEVLERVPKRSQQCLRALGSRLPKMNLPGMVDSLDAALRRHENVRPLGFLLGCIATLALIVAGLRRWDPGDVFALGSMAVLLIYFDFDERILVPTYAFALAATVELLVLAARRLVSLERARLVVAALVLVMGVLDAFPRNDRSFVEERNRVNAAVAEYVEERFPPDVVVGGSLGHKLAVFFDRPVWFFEVAISRKGRLGARTVLAKRDVDAFIHTGEDNYRLTTQLKMLIRELESNTRESAESQARLVHEIEGVRIYRLRKQK